MLTHKGTQPIKTERLFLREIKKGDWRDMYRYTQKEEVAKYVTWNAHKSSKETKAVCNMWVDEYKSGEKYHWAIVYDGRVIGNIEVVKIVDGVAMLGWQIDSLYWNRGIMTEAAAAVVDFMFSEIHVDAVEAAHIDKNIGSGRVMQKIGMKAIDYSESLHYKLKSETEINGDKILFYRLARQAWEHDKTNRS